MVTWLSARSELPSAPLARYAVASLGPIALATSQFILLLQMLHTLSASDFGIFSFLLIVTQLCLGVSNALICGPLAVVFSSTPEANRAPVMDGLFSFNTAYCLATFLAVAVVSCALGASASATLLFAAYSATSMLRWAGRAYGYATANWIEPVISDSVSSLTILIGAAASVVAGSSIESTAFLLLVSAVIGVIPFGRNFIRHHLSWPNTRMLLERYGVIWQQYARWTFIGVTTTEATANSHAYIVTLVNGPHAFALLAAGALITRPITVMMNALSEFERPVMARRIAAHAIAHVQRDVSIFRATLLVTWIVTAAIAYVLMDLAPRLIFPARYSLQDLVLVIALWMAVALVRVARMPESTALQGAGRFKGLAYASVVSSAVSVVLVGVIVLLGDPIMSIVGVLVGEIIFAIGIWHQFSLWKRSAN